MKKVEKDDDSKLMHFSYELIFLRLKELCFSHIWKMKCIWIIKCVLAADDQIEITTWNCEITTRILH